MIESSTAEGAGTLSIESPLITVVVAVYKDWAALEGCLSSLAQQVDVPAFEVVVVDDGSETAVPDHIRKWEHSYPMTVVTQAHSGIGAARNRGIEVAKGSVVMFVDADCKLQRQCMAELKLTLEEYPRHNWFQLRVIGDTTTLVGRAEMLRLMATQKQLLQPDGHILYLNTAGFALRKRTGGGAQTVFDEAISRGEDSLLLAKLIERHEAPMFVADAVVQHSIPLSLAQCLAKDIRSAYLEQAAFRIIRSKGLKVRMSNRERMRLLSAMWTMSKRRSIGRTGWGIVVIRQSLQRIVGLTCEVFRAKLLAP